MNTIVDLNTGNDNSVIQSCYSDSLEYGMDVIRTYEETFKVKKSASLILGKILESFPTKKLSEIRDSIVKLSQTEDDSTIEVLKRKVEIARPKAQDITPVNMRSKMYKEITDDIDAKLEYRKNFLLDEYRKLKKIILIIEKDLTIAKNYLDGEVNHRNKALSIQILDRFYKNEIPDFWLSEVSSFNIEITNFESFLKSIMIKFDNLYYLSIELPKLPPILAIDRLLDPASFFVNAALFNSLKNDVKIPILLTL